MTLAARLNAGETLGDRVMKVDHAGEHGAICIYLAQRWMARWRAPDLVEELGEFLDHERSHRARFGAELTARGVPRCVSYPLCGLGGLLLGAVTGLFGRGAIAATTMAIERVVLRHMHEQVEALRVSDAAATTVLREIIRDEQRHHDVSADHLAAGSWWPKIITPVIAASTETVIWIGMMGPG
jgi:ubiquinone biosynthesis monooxygenase Coq7